MSDAVPSSPASGRQQDSRCTVASWVVLVGGLALTFAAYQWAVMHRSGGDWFPGLGEALIGIVATALASFGTGLAALLRRERCAWAAWPPLIAGLTTIVYFTYNILSKR